MKALLTLAILAVSGFVINAVALALIGPVWTVSIPPGAMGWVAGYAASVLLATVWGIASSRGQYGEWWMALAGPVVALVFGVALFGAMRTHNTVPTPCYDCPPAPW